MLSIVESGYTSTTQIALVLWYYGMQIKTHLDTIGTSRVGNLGEHSEIEPVRTQMVKMFDDDHGDHESR